MRCLNSFEGLSSLNNSLDGLKILEGLNSLDGLPMSGPYIGLESLTRTLRALRASRALRALQGLTKPYNECALQSLNAHFLPEK